MGVLKVLGLQLCLLAFCIGAEARFEWSASDTKDRDEEPNSMSLPPVFETGYEAEAPEFGLEVNHQDPQDFDIMMMTHRVKRSEEKKKKGKRTRPGALSGLAGFPGIPDGKPVPETPRVRRSEEKKKKKKNNNRNKSRVGSYAPLGGISPPNVMPAPDVVRAKRQLKDSGTPPKKRPGKYSTLGHESKPTPVPTKSLD